jgi:hypothetical protein
MTLPPVYKACCAATLIGGAILTAKFGFVALIGSIGVLAIHSLAWSLSMECLLKNIHSKKFIYISQMLVSFGFYALLEIGLSLFFPIRFVEILALGIVGALFGNLAYLANLKRVVEKERIQEDNAVLDNMHKYISSFSLAEAGDLLNKVEFLKKESPTLERGIKLDQCVVSCRTQAQGWIEKLQQQKQDSQ